MKKILLILTVILLSSTLVWSEPPRIRPKASKSEQVVSKKKKTVRKKPVTTVVNPTPDIHRPVTPPVVKVKQDFPSNETIGGFNVTWAKDVTNEEHKIVKGIINDMVFVPGGRFKMGSTDWDNEIPVHTVKVKDFYMGKYEITQNQWEMIMGTIVANAEGDNYPMHSVTYNDVNDFIEVLNEMTGLTFRLPSEAEWEYAAIGGPVSSNNRFSGSALASTVGWTSNNSDGRLHPVGQLDPNELGLYDMTGNVSEWTADNYSQNYTYNRNSDQYVVRGGNYNWDDPDCTNTARWYYPPTSAYLDNGFRLVLVR